LSARLASATFKAINHADKIARQAGMIQLAGSPDRVIPGLDSLQLKRSPTIGRPATIR
jgi:hypothetical protein